MNSPMGHVPVRKHFKYSVAGLHHALANQFDGFLICQAISDKVRYPTRHQLVSMGKLLEKRSIGQGAVVIQHLGKHSSGNESGQCREINCRISRRGSI